MKRIVMPVLAVFFLPVFVSDMTLRFSNSVFSIAAFSGLYALEIWAGKMELTGRKKRYANVLGAVFSVMTAFGSQLEGIDGIPYGNVAFWFSIVLYARAFGQGLGILWTIMEQKENVFRAHQKLDRDKGRLTCAAEWLFGKPVVLWLLLLVCWAPCYISTFPGNLVYDASYEYYQLQTGFTKSFPLLHSAIISCYDLLLLLRSFHVVFLRHDKCLLPLFPFRLPVIFLINSHRVGT